MLARASAKGGEASSKQDSTPLKRQSCSQRKWRFSRKALGFGIQTCSDLKDLQVLKQVKRDYRRTQEVCFQCGLANHEWQTIRRCHQDNKQKSDTILARDQPWQCHKPKRLESESAQVVGNMTTIICSRKQQCRPETWTCCNNTC